MTNYQAPQNQPLAYQPPRKPKHTFRNLAFVGLAAIVLIITVAVATGGSKKDDNGPAKSPGVSRGIAAKDASADVTKVTCGTASYGLMSGQVAITNHSGGRSDYTISVVYLDAKGTHLGEGTAFVQNVEAHQKAVTDLVGTVTGKPASCKVTEVQRTASV